MRCGAFSRACRILCLSWCVGAASACRCPLLLHRCIRANTVSRDDNGLFTDSLFLQGSLSFGMDLFDVYPAMSWLITVFGPMLQVRNQRAAHS